MMSWPRMANDGRRVKMHMVFEGIDVSIRPELCIFIGGLVVAAGCVVWFVVRWLRRDGK